MFLIEIIAAVGSAVISTVFPNCTPLLDEVNRYLPAGKKLDSNTTGVELQKAVHSLPSDTQVGLFRAKFNVQAVEAQEHTKVIQALGDVDKVGASTRPKIAMIMAYMVAFTITSLIFAIAWSIISEDNDTILALNGSWPLVTAVLAIPSALLRAYFGMRTKEKQQKYNALTGAAPIVGMIGQMIKGNK